MQNDTNTVQVDQELLNKARQLKSSALFTGLAEATRLREKQSIFLVIAGLKPLAEVYSTHLVAGANGQQRVADDRAAAMLLIRALGLAADFSRSDGETIFAVISLQENLVRHYLDDLTLNDMVEMGQLFGFPETAAEAYADGETLLSEQEQIQCKKSAGLTLLSIDFPLSREHWQQELGTLARWEATLKAYDLLA